MKTWRNYTIFLKNRMGCREGFYMAKWPIVSGEKLAQNAYNNWVFCAMHDRLFRRYLDAQHPHLRGRWEGEPRLAGRCLRPAPQAPRTHAR